MTQPVKPDSKQYSETVLPNFGTFAAVFALLPSIVIISEPFDLRVGLVIGVIAVSIIWTLLFLRAPKIEISKHDLTVARVTISRDLIGNAVAIGKDEIFAERGPNLDPSAHKVFQGSVKTAVKITIEDPEDPTPYWLVSTRNPKKIVELLRNP